MANRPSIVFLPPGRQRDNLHIWRHPDDVLFRPHLAELLNNKMNKKMTHRKSMTPWQFSNKFLAQKTTWQQSTKQQDYMTGTHTCFVESVSKCVIDIVATFLFCLLLPARIAFQENACYPCDSTRLGWNNQLKIRNEQSFFIKHNQTDLYRLINVLKYFFNERERILRTIRSSSAGGDVFI